MEGPEGRGVRAGKGLTFNMGASPGVGGEKGGSGGGGERREERVKMY